MLFLNFLSALTGSETTYLKMAGKKVITRLLREKSPFPA
ncbi:hypothetical protein BN137_3587 [Cronobacter condimenti 1330]|uniref:Uncharacterized protein n=1 Tax=Cronobacter condimenti 1330 TaxID=1073999 RepID=K8A3R2_9ENTR|nr:hypothetical protein BN137_3587 [Cronobacter condimenti 1330]